MNPRKKTLAFRLEKIFEFFILLSALVAILGVLLISLFVLISGIPPLFKINFFDFLFGTNWSPSEDPPSYEIFPFIVGTFIITIGALLIAVPIGIASGIFLSEISKGIFTRFIRSITELLAAIPTVVYGFFGNIVIAPWVQQTFKVEGNTGYNAFSAMIVVSIVLLPLIINMTYISLKAIPKSLKQASLALGANQWQTISKVLLPAARSGVIAGVVMAMGRAIGETMIVLMVAGGSPLMPESIFSPVRTLTGAIAMDMGYASDEHRAVLFSIGALLFLLVMIIGFIKNKIIKKLSYSEN